MISLPTAHAFVVESNRIEGITRQPTPLEVAKHRELWALDAISVGHLEDFVLAVAGKSLRRRRGQDVSVGGYYPPAGGPNIEPALEHLLLRIHTEVFLTPHAAHREYERLHPFMDGNGRSGRALWAWHMLHHGLSPFDLPFLHRWYYHSLAEDPARVAAR